MKNLVQKYKRFRINVKKFLYYVKTNYLTPLIVKVTIISLFLLVQCSPVLSFLWLSVTTLYFLYIGRANYISKIWGITFFMWYLIFTISLSEVTILIGFENTNVIVVYLLDSDVLCKNLCFQTVFLLDALSAKLGFTIYIPNVINIFSFFSKLFKNKKTGCSGKGDSGEKNKSSWFSSGKPKKSQSEADMSLCEVLAKELEKKGGNVFYSQNSMMNDDGNRTVIYTKIWLPGFGTRNFCYARDSNKLEKELFKNTKK